MALCRSSGKFTSWLGRARHIIRTSLRSAPLAGGEDLVHGVGLDVPLVLIRRRPMQPRRDIARRNVAGILADLLRAGPRLDVRRRRRSGGYGATRSMRQPNAAPGPRRDPSARQADNNAVPRLSMWLFTSMCLASPYSRREALVKQRTGLIAAELIPARALSHTMENDGPD